MHLYSYVPAGHWKAGIGQNICTLCQLFYAIPIFGPEGRNNNSTREGSNLGYPVRAARPRAHSPFMVSVHLPPRLGMTKRISGRWNRSDYVLAWWRKERRRSLPFRVPHAALLLCGQSFCHLDTTKTDSVGGFWCDLAHSLLPSFLRL